MSLRFAGLSVLGAVCLGCEVKPPTLADLSAPAITAQRRQGGDLQVFLSYDTVKTPCGTVPNLRATFDGAAVSASGGLSDPKGATETERCQFPGFLLAPARSTTSRSLTFTDDVTTFGMEIDTLELGSVLAQSPPASFHPGTVLEFTSTLPSQGTRSWTVTYTPTGGTATTWASGGTLASRFEVTVPTIAAASSGTLAVTWQIDAHATRCEGLTRCEVVVEGQATLAAVVSP